MDNKFKKRLATITALLATPYVGLTIYYIISLFIAYAIKKEECPMGFIVLPYFIYPAIFISWLRLYLGNKFMKNCFSFRMFVKYTIGLLIIESMFWIWQYFNLLHLKLVLVCLPIFLLINCYIFWAHLHKKREEDLDVSNDFYLGIELIRFIDIFQGAIFAFLMIPLILLDLKSLFWIKEFSLNDNIYNLGFKFLILSLTYPYFWVAFNIKKFYPKSRVYQIFISALSICHAFVGSPFLFFIPIHFFIITYLNVPNIKRLFFKKRL